MLVVLRNLLRHQTGLVWADLPGQNGQARSRQQSAIRVTVWPCQHLSPQGVTARCFHREDAPGVLVQHVARIEEPVTARDQ